MAKPGGNGKFGIIVSGGPAPGINSVIASTVIEASNQGYEICGLRDGFHGVCDDKEEDAVVPLRIENVSSQHNTGGSILGTSRFNPFAKEETKKRFLKVLQDHGIDKVIVVGGEGSAYLSNQLVQCAPGLRVIHVPKTIDNDLVLPQHLPSFGFETARYAGTKILDTLMVDARTTKRFFLITSMGRRAGFLALGLGIAAGATATFIPEEFTQKISPEDFARMILTAIEKRKAAGREYGIFIMAEGILDLLDTSGEPELESAARDELGRIRYSQIELGEVIARALHGMSNDQLTVTTKNLGYELRCHPPISYDVEYTKFLGYGAVHHLLNGRHAGMVTKEHDTLGYLPFAEFVAPDGTVQSRRVDLGSDLYRVARSFMIR